VTGILTAWLLAAALLVAACAVVAQPPGAAGKAVRVVVLSDFNESYGSVRYSAHVDAAVARTLELAPDLVVSAGDMVAGQRLSPMLNRRELDAMWSAFHRHVSDPLARAGLPFAVVPGNHDASAGDRFRLERTVFREQWLARRPGVEFLDATHWPFQYAFRVGDVLFAALDVTGVGHLPAAQMQWLRRLLDAEGPKHRHRVVISHLPLWPFAVGRETEFIGDPQLEAILRHGRVDLHLSGHHHAWFPGYKDGVRYVSQGCLGAAPRPLIGTREPIGRTLSVIEFDGAGGIRVEGLGGPSFGKPVPRASLPPAIETRWATIVRDDLAIRPAGTPRTVGHLLVPHAPRP
jgi:hypothetical protein